MFVFFFQAEDGIRDLVRSRGLGDVYKRQDKQYYNAYATSRDMDGGYYKPQEFLDDINSKYNDCLLYTSDAADERSSVDLGGRRIIKKKTKFKL